jgi:hypothetical protein
MNARRIYKKGYDAGKKVSGIRCHIAVDTQELPHAIAVTTTEVTDRKGALKALERGKPSLKRVESLCCVTAATRGNRSLRMYARFRASRSRIKNQKTSGALVR